MTYVFYSQHFKNINFVVYDKKIYFIILFLYTPVNSCSNLELDCPNISTYYYNNSAIQLCCRTTVDCKYTLKVLSMCYTHLTNKFDCKKTKEIIYYQP